MHKLIVISAPSGCGKTSLVKALINNNSDFRLSISHTTRKVRKHETNGADYFFVNKNIFDKMVNNNEFVEHAKVFDNYYGTSKTTLENMLKTHSVIIEIDWQGARQVKQVFNDVNSIFILPPSIEELKKRLILRGDDKEIVERRMLEAKNEISHKDEYNYQVINDDFNIALSEIENILNNKN